MAASGAAIVTIDSNHFETSVRSRAKFVSSKETAWTNPLAPGPFSSPVIQNADTNHDDDPRTSFATHVKIPTAEYDDLVLVSRQYANLTRALLKGGIDIQTINLLSADEGSWPTRQQPAPVPETPNQTQISDDSVCLSTPAQAPPPIPDTGYGEYPSGCSNDPSRFSIAIPGNDVNNRTERSPHNEHLSNAVSGKSGPVTAPREQEAEPPMINGRPLLRVATRTLLLYNLPDGVTHGDITDVVRGGPLLDVFMRNDRSCTVSFVHGQDARIFFDHIKRNDLYLKNKRIEIKWSDRQFQLLGHIANKIRVGASRNLVIRHCGKEHTNETIRDDLAHIHNLVVIKVETIAGNCYIRTNSVHNAIFARTCMMSRLKYRGSKIVWDVDECAQPLDLAPARHTNDYRAPNERKSAAPQISNRFQALTLECGEDDDQDTSPDIPTQTFANVAF